MCPIALQKGFLSLAHLKRLCEYKDVYNPAEMKTSKNLHLKPLLPLFEKEKAALREATAAAAAEEEEEEDPEATQVPVQ